ncbi:MAG: hypothetical protein PHC64_03030 [Candidatus Gastranaerophilales bacterium]|nr:hypothetical protein [Candidatus Gastranaerophilales bacterium]
MAAKSKKDSRTKKGDSKKLVFAKSKEQAIATVIVLCIFVANSIYLIVKNIMEQMPKTTQATVTEQPRPEDLLAEQNPENSATQPPSPVQEQNTAQDANDIYAQTVAMQQNTPQPNANPNHTEEENPDIMIKKAASKRSGKMVLITVANSGRSNPFLPETENYVVPKNSIYSYLPAPPETLPTNTDATKVISTTISGILYDKYSPSAIINIQGTDYLVKKGDIISNYRVLGIDKSEVVVQLGNNIYKAGVGQLLAQTNLSNSNIPNLNKKFGGNDIAINVRKKGY